MALGYPTSETLAAAVKDFLAGLEGNEVEGKLAYEVRVARNILAILEREFAQGLRHDELARARLSQLLGREGELAELNAGLAMGLRDGSVDFTHSEVIDHLRKTAVSRLSIDNPRYSAYQRAIK